MSEWQPFTGEYEKQFYEAKQSAGSLPIKHMWPNAGRLVATDGSGIEISKFHGFLFRPCTCGHKHGGCDQPSPSPEAEA